MSGALIQLLAQGGQDLFLTGNPTVTMFDMAYEQYGKFAIEVQAQTFSGQPDFGKTARCPLGRIGDLIGPSWLDALLPSLETKEFSSAGSSTQTVTTANPDQATWRWCDYPGEFLCEEVVFDIGGARIDTQDGQWFHLYRQLWQEGNTSRSRGEDLMVGQQVPKLGSLGAAYATLGSLWGAAADAKAYTGSIYDATNDEPTNFSAWGLVPSYLPHGTGSTTSDYWSLYNQMSTAAGQAPVFSTSGANSADTSAKATFAALTDVSKNSAGASELSAGFPRFYTSKYSQSCVTMGLSYRDGEPGANNGMDWAVSTDDYCSNQTYAQSKPAYRCNVPFRFWYCNHLGLAMPLISVQFHEVALTVRFRPRSQLTITRLASGAALSSTQSQLQGAGSASGTLGAQILQTYYYVSVLERDRLTYEEQEQLITQVQTTSDETATMASYTVNLTSFSHPMKELVWTVQSMQHVANNDWANFEVDVVRSSTQNSGDGAAARLFRKQNPVVSARLQFNGQERFQEREGSFFNLTVPSQHHTAIPSSHGVNVYSFAANAEAHQPQSTANFSRFDTANLKLQLQGVGSAADTTGSPANATSASYPQANVRVYGVNYNILEFENGLAGILYTS